MDAIPYAVKDLVREVPVCPGEGRLAAARDSGLPAFSTKLPQGAAIGRSAHLTMALRIYRWTEWGIVAPLPYQPE
jgi:hypothetical protein